MALGKSAYVFSKRFMLLTWKEVCSLFMTIKYLGYWNKNSNLGQKIRTQKAFSLSFISLEHLSNFPFTTRYNLSKTASNINDASVMEIEKNKLAKHLCNDVSNEKNFSSVFRNCQRNVCADMKADVVQWKFWFRNAATLCNNWALHGGIISVLSLFSNQTQRQLFETASCVNWRARRIEIECCATKSNCVKHERSERFFIISLPCSFQRHSKQRRFSQITKMNGKYFPMSLIWCQHQGFL